MLTERSVSLSKKWEKKNFKINEKQQRKGGK